MKKAIFLIYEVFIFLPIALFSTMITAIVVMIGVSLGNKSFWSYYPPMYWSKIVCRTSLCCIRIIKKGKLDPKQSYVFVPNHQGVFDIFLMYGYLNQNIKWVQKKELRKIPFVGKASEMAGHVFVDQSNIGTMKATIREAASRIKNGISMVLFAEGARTKTGKLGRFKRGAFLIAKELNLPIVPITINGAFDVMKIHTYLLHPGKLELVIHEPIPTVNLSEEDLPALMEKCKSVIHEGLWEKYK